MLKVKCNWWADLMWPKYVGFFEKLKLQQHSNSCWQYPRNNHWEGRVFEVALISEPSSQLSVAQCNSVPNWFKTILACLLWPNCGRTPCERRLNSTAWQYHMHSDNFWTLWFTVQLQVYIQCIFFEHPISVRVPSKVLVQKLLNKITGLFLD